jgi:uncharacterized protein YndB with AHSA1/START domain
MATKITVSAVVNASATTVWERWTNPKHITQWNFADPSWCCPSAENDLRVGGKYMARMEARDGSFGFDFVMIYDKVSIEQELSSNMEDGRNATTTFEKQGDATLVTTVFDAENENPIELQQGGWQMILNNFKAYAESE